MRYLRWEAIPLLRPFANPNDASLGVPIASGLIARENANIPANLGPSDPITLPQAPDGAPFLLLRLEAMSDLGWIVTVGAPGTTPNAGTGAMDAVDAVPRILVPRASSDAGFRSIEVRAVKPGSVFVARMWQ